MPILFNIILMNKVNHKATYQTLHAYYVYVLFPKAFKKVNIIIIILILWMMELREHFMGDYI